MTLKVSPCSYLYPYNAFEQATSRPIYCKCSHPQVIIDSFYSKFILFLGQPTRQKLVLTLKTTQKSLPKLQSLSSLEKIKHLKQIKIIANSFVISFSSSSASKLKKQLTWLKCSIKNSFSNVQSRRSGVWGFLSPFFVRVFQSFTLPDSSWERLNDQGQWR